MIKETDTQTKRNRNARVQKKIKTFKQELSLKLKSNRQIIEKEKQEDLIKIAVLFKLQSMFDRYNIKY